MEEIQMSERMKIQQNKDPNTSVPEILFAALLGIGAVSCIWVSTTLLIHLYQNLN